MSVKSQQSVTVEFTTAHPTTGAPTSGDTTPTGILFVDGVANAAAVTVTNITTGVYKAAVTLPTLTAGQVVGIRITAVVATVSGTSVVWQDTADTALPSDNATAIAAIPTTPLLAANYTAPANADITTIKNAIGTPVNTGGTATIAAILGDPANAPIGPKTKNLPASPAAVGSAMLITAGTGTGQLDVTSGVVKANLAQILGTALTETAGYLAAGFKKFFNVPMVNGGTIITVADTQNVVKSGGTGDLAAIKAKTDNLPSDPADESLIEAAIAGIDGKIGTPVNTDGVATIAGILGDPGADGFTTIEVAIQGTSLMPYFSARDGEQDVFADLSAIKAKTANLPSDPADESLLEAAIAAATPTIDLTPVTDKTDNLPADPASQADVEAAIAAATPVVDFTDVLEAIAALPDDTDVATVEVLLNAIKAVTDAIESSPLNVTFSVPVTEAGTINLYSGDSYPVKHGRIGIPVAITDATHALDLDAEGTTVRLKAAQVTWEADSVTSTATGWLVTWTPTVAETKALTVARQSYEVEAEYAETAPPDNVSTIFTGTLVSVPDIPAVS